MHNRVFFIHISRFWIIGFTGYNQVDVHFAFKYEKCYSDVQKAIHLGRNEDAWVLHLIVIIGKPIK